MNLLQVAREALVLVLVLSAAPLVVSLVVGLVVGLLGAATQVQDQSLSQVPRLIAVVVTLILVGPWMGAELVRFTRLLFEGFAGLR